MNIFNRKSKPGIPGLEQNQELTDNTADNTAVPAVEPVDQQQPEPPAPNYCYTPRGDRFPLDTINNLNVITTTGSFSFRVGDKFKDSLGNEYIFVHLLPQTGAVSYILCTPVCVHGFS